MRDNRIKPRAKMETCKVCDRQVGTTRAGQHSQHFASMAAEPRRHPDLFTAEQAAQYLHLDEMHDDGQGAGVMEKALRTLRTLIERRLLAPTPIGKHNMFHRANLDHCVQQLIVTGIAEPPTIRVAGPKRGRLRQYIGNR
jgi:hypothetical protein